MKTTKISLEEMVTRGVRYIVYEDRTFLYVEDVKSKFPTVKINTNQTALFRVGKVETVTIEHENIQDMTEFDEKIKKSLMFNPKDK